MWKINIFISKELLYHAKDSLESIAEFVLVGPDSPDCPDYKVVKLADQIKVSIARAAPSMVIEVVKNFEDLRTAYPKDFNSFSIEISQNVTRREES